MVDLAIAVATERPRCVIRTLGSTVPIDAELSDAMVERRIWVRPGDLVRVNLAANPPEVVYRWRKATVVGVQNTSITIATVPTDDDLSMSASALVLSRLGIAPAVGDTVFVDVRFRRPVVVDIASEDEPTHPERFGEQYAQVRDEIRNLAAVTPVASESSRMHADELEIEAALVRRLLRAQRPQWADLPLERVPSSGTDNAMFRLGDDMVVRVPRIGWAVEAVEHEHRWLPLMAPHLPLAVPVPLWKGEPGEGYPWPWSVYSWLDGEAACSAQIGDMTQAAKDVARFIAALQSIDTTDGPMPSADGAARLATVDHFTRRSIAAAKGLVDTDAMTAAWEAALRVPEWDRPPVWVHRDVDSRNLLVRDGRICAVIDWSGLAVGDPASNLVVAWEFFDADSREVFRRELDVDDATWDRGRGWALTAVAGLSYYLHTNPVIVARARRTIAAALAERHEGDDT